MMDFFNDVVAWFNSIPDLIQQTIEWWIAWWSITWLKFQIYLVETMWGAGKQILEQLNISGAINSALQQTGATTMQALAFFRVPEAINMILSSGAARLAMRAVGI